MGGIIKKFKYKIEGLGKNKKIKLARKRPLPIKLMAGIVK